MSANSSNYYLDLTWLTVFKTFLFILKIPPNFVILINLKFCKHPTFFKFTRFLLDIAGWFLRNLYKGSSSSICLSLTLSGQGFVQTALVEPAFKSYLLSLDFFSSKCRRRRICRTPTRRPSRCRPTLRDCSPLYRPPRPRDCWRWEDSRHTCPASRKKATKATVSKHSALSSLI